MSNQAMGSAAVNAVSPVFDQKAVLSCVYPLGVICLLVPSFAGVSIAMAKATQGICQAAAIRNEVTLTIIPSGFIGMVILYAIILFFVGYHAKEVPACFGDCMPWFAGQVVGGLGFFWTAIGLGEISRVAIVTVAQQKKFISSFFVLLVFGEFVGIFSVVTGLFLTTSWVSPSSVSTN